MGRILKTLTTTLWATINKVQRQLRPWIDTHSVSGKWISYQDQNRQYYTRESHKDTKWKVEKHTNKGIKLTCSDHTIEY